MEVRKLAAQKQRAQGQVDLTLVATSRPPASEASASDLGPCLRGRFGFWLKKFKFREAARRSMMASDLSVLGQPHPAVPSPCVYSFQHHWYCGCPFLTFALFLFLSFSLCNLWHPTSLINIRPPCLKRRQVPRWPASRGDPPQPTSWVVTSSPPHSAGLYWAIFPQTRPGILNINGRHCSHPRATISPIPTYRKRPARRI